MGPLLFSTSVAVPLHTRRDKLALAPTKKEAPPATTPVFDGVFTNVLPYRSSPGPVGSWRHSTEPLNRCRFSSRARRPPLRRRVRTTNARINDPGLVGRTLARERSRTIRNDLPSPIAATGMLSLGLLIPFGAGTVPDQLAKTVAAIAAPSPAKHVTLVRDGLSETIETRAASAEDLLAERSVIRTPEDALSVDPASLLYDGETVVYRAAVPVTVVVAGIPRTLRSAAANVADLLHQQAVAFDRHDRISPAPAR